MFVIKFKGKILGAYHSLRAAHEAAYDKAIDLAESRSSSIEEMQYQFSKILEMLEVKKASKKEVRYG